jgi:trehalose/maltose hydrolase-like predicted phosphorylase
VWQALAYGFLGLRPHDDHLRIAPRLPADWDGLGLRLRFHGHPLGVHAGHDHVAIACQRSLRVAVDGDEPRRCDPPGQSFRIEGIVR